jgi:uncharacterized membrane protein YcaP (DUF421 family)
MIDTIQDTASTLLGLNADELNVGQMVLRAALTFIVTVAFLRIGDKRLLGKGTAFDVVVSIMIGSVMSRAITSPDALVATWAAGLALILAHSLLAGLAARVDWFGPLIKGNRAVLVENGDVRQDAMKQSGITTTEIEQVMRTNGHEPDLSTIKLATLERDGSISIVPKSGQPRAVTVSVEQGVQTVRIVME